MIAEAEAHLTPKSSSHIACSQIRMESARILCASIEKLKQYKNLTLSFDSGSGIRPQSFTTIHVTNPDIRVVHLVKAVEASGVSHPGKYYLVELEKASIYAFRTQWIDS